jgi:hypothetical protein
VGQFLLKQFLLLLFVLLSGFPPDGQLPASVLLPVFLGDGVDELDVELAL